MTKRSMIYFTMAIAAIIFVSLRWAGTFFAGPDHTKVLTRPPKVMFFTFVNMFTDWSGALAMSLYHYGSYLNVLGLNGTICEIMCSVTRHESMLRFLNSPAAEGLDDTLICMMDGFDVLFQRHVSHVVDAYLKLEKQSGIRRPIILASEENCFPYGAKGTGGWGMAKDVNIPTMYGVFKGSELCKLMTEHGLPGPYYYVNGGGYCGYPKEIKAWCEKVIYTRIQDDNITNKGDQAACQLTMLRYPDLKAFVDGDSNIFLTFQKHNETYFNRPTCGKDYFIDNEPPDFVYTGTKPVILHFNGKGKTKYRRNCTQRFDTHFRQFESNKGAFYVDVDQNNTVILNRYV